MRKSVFVLIASLCIGIVGWTEFKGAFYRRALPEALETIGPVISHSDFNPLFLSRLRHVAAQFSFYRGKRKMR